MRANLTCTVMVPHYMYFALIPNGSHNLCIIARHDSDCVLITGEQGESPGVQEPAPGRRSHYVVPLPLHEDQGNGAEVSDHEGTL